MTPMLSANYYTDPGTAMFPGLFTEEGISFAKAFCEDVDRLIRTDKMGVIEAIVYLAEERGMEPDCAAELINADLKDRLTTEAQALHLVQKQAMLPI